MQFGLLLVFIFITFSLQMKSPAQMHLKLFGFDVAKLVASNIMFHQVTELCY